MEHYVTVTGRGAFPHDMMRREALHFSTPSEATRADSDDQIRSIELVKHAPRQWQTDYRRWISFGWTAQMFSK